MIKVYIQTNSNGEVININSSVFLLDTFGWLQIDEGEGDKYAHAQSNYLKKPIINESGKHNYRYYLGKIVEI